VKRAFHVLITIYLAIIVLNLDIISPIGNSTPIEKGLLLLCGVVFLLGRKVNLAVLALIGVMALTTMVTAMGTDFYGFSTDRYLRGLISLLTPWLLLAGDPTEEDRDLLIKLFAWMPLADLAVGGLYAVLHLHELRHTDFLGVSRLQGSSIPAGLGSICYVGAFAASIGWAQTRSWRYLALLGVNLVILLLTAARAPFFLAMLAIAAVYLTLYRHTMTSFVATLLGGPAVGIAAFLLVGASLLARFSSNSLSGREMIWQALRDVLRAYPTFGIGLGHQILVVPEQVTKLTTTIAAHDEYLRIAVECGYAGAAIIFACLIAICINIWLSKRVGMHPVFLLAAATFFIYCNSDNAISSSVTSFIIIVAAFAFPVKSGVPVAVQTKASESARRSRRTALS
jgi:O-antigen ligase